MFRHEGPSRDVRKNALLAAYLAFVAGFVNSGGFVMLGTFTSHVTGSVGRLSTDVAAGDMTAATFALILILAFFFGALLASLILGIEVRAVASVYAAALFSEAALIGTFIMVTRLRADSPRLLDLQAAILCVAMGMQNSMVTRLSGAVVRTTHLTGVVTDLGIEAAQWLTWLRKRDARPKIARSFLLLTIALSFTLGAISGASLTVSLRRWAMLLPMTALLAASLYALVSARRDDGAVNR